MREDLDLDIKKKTTKKCKKKKNQNHMVWFLMKYEPWVHSVCHSCWKKKKVRNTNLKPQTESKPHFSSSIVSRYQHQHSVTSIIGELLPLSLNHPFLCIMFTLHQKGLTKLWFFTHPVLELNLISLPFDAETKEK